MCDTKGKFKKTPCRRDISEVDESEELNEEVHRGKAGKAHVHRQRET